MGVGRGLSYPGDLNPNTIPYFLQTHCNEFPHQLLKITQSVLFLTEEYS